MCCQLTLKMSKWIFVVCCSLISLVSSQVSDEAKQLTLKWAPFIWLHSEETFFPVNPEFVIANVEVRDTDENVVQANPTFSTIVRGPGTENYHLNTFTDIECVNCYEDYFFGQQLPEVKLYALVKEWNDPLNTIDVRFATYYAYNQGKDVCIGLDPSGFCLGITETFGNHVGDGDSNSIRFQNGSPAEIYLSVHSFGAYYYYDNSTNTFEFYKGEELVKNDGRIVVNYPKTVTLVEGTHPEIFAANGSHGYWATEGKHNYFNIVIHLDDLCDRGTAWRTWENIEFLDITIPTEDYPSELAWGDFRGAWGNIQELGCQLEPIVGECGLNSAGGGPIPSSHSVFEPPQF